MNDFVLRFARFFPFVSKIFLLRSRGSWEIELDPWLDGFYTTVLIFDQQVQEIKTIGYFEIYSDASIQT